MLTRHIQSVPGIILKKLAYGEADEIITVLLEHLGLAKFFVRGSRKSQKRFCGRIDHFRHLKFQYRATHQGLWSLDGVEDVSDVIQNFAYQDPLIFAFMTCVAEFICVAAPEGSGDHGLYAMWQKMVQEFSLQGFSYDAACHYFSKVLTATGYSPNNRNDSNKHNNNKELFGRLLGFSQDMIQKRLASADFLWNLMG